MGPVGSNYPMSGSKKILNFKNQGKGGPSLLNGPPLKPLFSAINKTIKNIES